MDSGEFQEVGHCGGQFIVTTETNEAGKRSYRIGLTFSRPVPASFFGIYVLPPGVPVAPIQFAGIGGEWNPPPVPRCISVMIASDTDGYFGYECKGCNGYWRSRSAPSHWQVTCPYCGCRDDSHHFVTEGQTKYIQEFCRLVERALRDSNDGDHVIDMDAISDAVGKGAEKPQFYYSEERQQNNFACSACGCKSDILGKFGYCPSCGTRNDLNHFEQITIKNIRDRIHFGGPYEDCVRDSVSGFDSLARQYVQQLAKRVPMRPQRRAKFEKMLFHNPLSFVPDVKAVFDIDIFHGISDVDKEFVKLMFHRRHVYEHNGGEADEKYIRESGDNSVRLKQALRETQSTSQRCTEIAVKMARNLHQGFHEIFPPEDWPIQLWKRRGA